MPCGIWATSCAPFFGSPPPTLVYTDFNSSAFDLSVSAGLGDAEPLDFPEALGLPLPSGLPDFDADGFGLPLALGDLDGLAFVPGTFSVVSSTWRNLSSAASPTFW